MIAFLESLKGYFIEVAPALIIGFLLSGIINEFVPSGWVERYLGKPGARPILYSSVIGTILPICCWGSLPVAISFYKKGSRIGPILAFLVTTPATSVSALMVSYNLLGPRFTVYIFFSVILMGMTIGILGNLFAFEPKRPQDAICPECGKAKSCCDQEKGPKGRMASILKFSFIEMPKDLGLEIMVGLILAALVATLIPIGRLIELYLAGFWAYPLSTVFGLIMYFCSTASVPLVDALLRQGMNVGAGLVLLLVGPITSYGTILVLKKEFGLKILIFYISSICILAILLGWVYQLFLYG